MEGFAREFYNADGCGLLDSCGDIRVACHDFLGLEVNTRKSVLFNFECLPQFYFVAKESGMRRVGWLVAQIRLAKQR